VERNYTGDKHLLRAEYWLKQLKPDADEAMVIAVTAHDIERAFPEGRNSQSHGAKWNDREYCLWHGRRSADFVERFLRESGFANLKIIEKVKQLIIYHEIGGSVEKNLIKDSDSLSYFENNVGLFLSWIPTKATKGEIKEKFDWMFKRISSPRAKKLTLPFYNKAISELGKI